MTATEDLSKALLRYAERGSRPRCGDGETSYAWTSDEADSRALAAAWCAGCPIADVCWAYAIEHDVTAGVWAGRDATTPDVRTEIRAARRRQATARHAPVQP